MAHATPHPLAGQTVYLRVNQGDPLYNAAVTGAQFIVNDWWDRVSGRGWKADQLNLPQMRTTTHYAIRVVYNFLPVDDEVVSGDVVTAEGNITMLIHNSEIGF